MIPAGQAMIGTGALAVELGVNKSTLCKWSKTRLRAARYGRGRFLVAKLRELGVLPMTKAPDPAPAARDLGGLVVVTVEELRRIIREEMGKGVAP